MISILHNPRCRKSREGLEILQNNTDQPINIVKYLNEPITKDYLSEIIHKLDIDPIQLVRTKESIWKENFKGKTLSDEEIIDAMLVHPKLIERPIVINGDHAIIGRPPEDVLKVL